MRFVASGLRRRMSQPLIVGTFVITASLASTGLATAGEVVIGLPATPPPPTLDLDITAPDDGTPDPPAPQEPFDITDGDGGEGTPTPDGPDDFVDGDGGDPDPIPPTGPDDLADGDGGDPDPTPPAGPDDFVDGDGGEGTPTPDGPDDFTDGDGGEGTPTPDGPDDFTNGDGGEVTPTPDGPDDFTDGDGGEPGDEPAPDGADGFVPTGEQSQPQTFDAAAPVANVAALPVTGAGDGLGDGQSSLAPVFALLAAGCLLATRLLSTNPGARKHNR